MGVLTYFIFLICQYEIHVQEHYLRVYGQTEQHYPYSVLLNLSRDRQQDYSTQIRNFHIDSVGKVIDIKQENY